MLVWPVIVSKGTFSFLNPGILREGLAVFITHSLSAASAAGSQGFSRTPAKCGTNAGTFSLRKESKVLPVTQNLPRLLILSWQLIQDELGKWKQ